MTFPLRHRPIATYHEPPRSFGAIRDGGVRKHAGCDLYAEPGTEVLAMEAGRVTRGCYPFYDVVFALEITAANGRVIRYGEIAGAAKGIRVGSEVAAGQVIATVGKMKALNVAMLHLEIYAGTGAGPLTDRENSPYLRRGDLLDPTPLLDAAAVAEAPAVVTS